MIDITADPDDPRRTPRVSVEHAREQIGLYGRDNPWVLVNIFGQFPPSSLNSLIEPEEVRTAMARCWRPFQIGAAPKVLGVDVARFGDDRSRRSSSVSQPAQGLMWLARRRARSVIPVIGQRPGRDGLSSFRAPGCPRPSLMASVTNSIVRIGENELSVDREELFKLCASTQIVTPRSVEISCDWRTPLQLQQTARAHS